MECFYVYAYIDPRDNTPFYIGKGHGDRDQDHLRRSVYTNPVHSKRFLYKKIRKLIAAGVQPVIHRVLDNLSEDLAFFWETFFIHALGRRNLGTGSLCNLTNGGEGTSGLLVSAETRRKQSQSHIGIRQSPEVCRLRAEARRGYRHTEETKHKISVAHCGKTLSTEHRKKLSEAHSHPSDETRKKLSEARKKRVISEATRLKISLSNRGRKCSEATKQKISHAKWSRDNGFVQPVSLVGIELLLNSLEV
jgi:hypothetical protein